MAYDVIRVVYEDMEQMSRTFVECAEQLNETDGEMKKIASALAEGALLGVAGDAFVEGIEGKLCPCINKLAEKMIEMAEDVNAAVQYAQEADQQSAAQF